MDNFIDFFQRHLVAKRRQRMTKVVNLNLSFTIIKHLESGFELIIRLLYLLTLKNVILKPFEINLARLKLRLRAVLQLSNLRVGQSKANTAQGNPQLVTGQKPFSLPIQKIEHLHRVVRTRSLLFLHHISTDSS